MDRAPQREIGLDILRGMAAFLVVCIHFPLEVRGGNYLDGLARVAVPLFFAFSGYFYQNTVKRNREAAQIKKSGKDLFGRKPFVFRLAGVDAYSEWHRKRMAERRVIPRGGQGIRFQK